METKYPPFVDENDSDWVRIMNTKTIIEYSTPKTDYKRFAFPKLAFGRQNHPLI